MLPHLLYDRAISSHSSSHTSSSQAIVFSTLSLPLHPSSRPSAPRYLDLPQLSPSDPIKSSISLSFSPCSRYLLSSHGDHSLKLTCCHTWTCLRSLVGHPRTPWTVKFHPSNPNIAASGCLGSQVRVWDIQTGKTESLVNVSGSVISVSLHSRLPLVIIGANSTLTIHDYEQQRTRSFDFTNSAGRRHLRATNFACDGDHIIVGLSNPVEQNSARSSHSPTFSIELYEFSMRAFLTKDEPFAERIKTVVERAVMYNDGGIGVSHDGLKMCTVAMLPIEDGKTVIEPVADVVPSQAAFNLPPAPPPRTLDLPSLDDSPPPARRCRASTFDNNFLNQVPTFPTLKTPRELAPHLIVVSLNPGSIGEVSHSLKIPAKLAKTITCCKFSALSEYILLGYGVRQTDIATPTHPVVSFYKPVGDSLDHINTVVSEEDDVNIAAFHPTGLGVAYGTKEGRVRVIAAEDRLGRNHVMSNPNLL